LAGRYFVPVIGKDRLVFSAMAKFGVVYQLDRKLPIPFKELYLTGGQDSLRGFKWGEAGPEYRKFNTPLGGKKELLMQFELITPASFNTSDVNTPRAYLFYDIGVAWDTPIAFDDLTNKPFITNPARDIVKNTFRPRHTVGFGFRMTSPQPVRVEWGYKLDRLYHSKERPSEWLLSMNMPFDF
jgi:outer membrane protein insertion porin family